MRILVLAAILLGMTMMPLAARQADTSGATRRSSAARQLVVNSGAGSPNTAQDSRQRSRKPADFSADRLIPDICSGC